MTDADESRRLVWERRAEWPLTVLALVFLAAYTVPILVPELAEPWLTLAGVVAAVTLGPMIWVTSGPLRRVG